MSKAREKMRKDKLYKDSKTCRATRFYGFLETIEEINDNNITDRERM